MNRWEVYDNRLMDCLLNQVNIVDGVFGSNIFDQFLESPIISSINSGYNCNSSNSRCSECDVLWRE